MNKAKKKKSRGAEEAALIRRMEVRGPGANVLGVPLTTYMIFLDKLAAVAEKQKLKFSADLLSYFSELTAREMFIEHKALGRIVFEQQLLEVKEILGDAKEDCDAVSSLAMMAEFCLLHLTDKGRRRYE